MDARQLTLFDQTGQEGATTKRCAGCGETLPVAAFNKRGDSSDGLTCSCRECIRRRAYDRKKIVVAKKRCQRCKATKDIAEFSEEERRPDGRRKACKACENQFYWRRLASDPGFGAKNAASARRGWLRRQLRDYAIDEATFEALSAKGCAICGGPPTGRGRYAFDHDRETGKFRGLLCSRRNSGLARFSTMWKSSPRRLNT